MVLAKAGVRLHVEQNIKLCPPSPILLRYAQLMSRSLVIIFVVLSCAACKGKGDGQWNLNKSIGWKPDKPDDYIILFVKLNNAAADSIELSDKVALDEAILKVLDQKGIGGRAENDDELEADLHFVLPKKYDEGFKAMRSVVKDRGYQDRVTLWRRNYDSLGRWTDQIIMWK
jgi:hypothetical protein